MSDPQYLYLIPTGTVIADTSATQSAVQQEYKKAFGAADLITTPDTPQGVLITAEVLARNNSLNNNAAVANQINPNISGGVFLDAVGLLTGSRRNNQIPTTVTNVVLTGLPGTTLQVGTQARTTAGDLFQLTQAVLIPTGGTTQGNFQSVAFGPIACAANTLTQIITPVLGWETVNNDPSPTPPLLASITTLGQTTQSDQAFRAFRRNTLGFQGLSLAAAQTSALYNVAGVNSLSYRENINDLPMGLITTIASGTTLSGTTWGMTTLQGTGTGTEGNLLVGTDALNFAQTAQTVPPVNPWPSAAFGTTGNITLSGLGTQGGGDWPSTLTTGQIILVSAQTTASQNGLYVCASGPWVRTYAIGGMQILGSNDGISMIANSVYACVDGGTAVDVAAALLENKSGGAGWNGNVLTNVIEPSSGQSYPVRNDTPQAVGILITATVSGVTTDQVTKALLDYQAGTVTDPAGNPSNLTGFKVGTAVSPFELAAAIAIENPSAYISNLTIAINTGSPSFSTTPIPMGLNQKPFTQLSFIVVNIV